MSEETDPMSLQHGGQRTAARVGAGSLVLLFGARLDGLPAAASGDPLVIGREPPPGGLTTPGTSASRVHARLARGAEGWTLTDLESRNGTIVNGHFVEQAALEHLDEIRIGDVIFKFVEEPPDGYAAFPLDGGGPQVDPALAPLLGGYRISQLRAEIAKIAPTSLSVLVLGETGTGKEVVARALHDVSRRAGAFAAVNCAAIPATLLESELFGYKRGAFTGADRERHGLVRSAHGGTLFLDEIGDMPLDAQAKVLRLLESREIVPLGATTAERVDVRLVCATHKNLRRLVEEGKFRGDLYARINGYTMTLPPLNERKEDIYVLARHFLARAGRPEMRLSMSFMLAALHYDWPYNVRELRSAIDRAVAVAEADELLEQHLPDDVRDVMRDYGTKARSLASSGERETARAAPAPQKGPPSELELREMLTRFKGNVAGIARELGKDRVQIHRWMRRFAISADDFREP